MFGSAISGNAILIARIGGKFYASDAICSHLYGYLPRGELRGNVVICPVHKAQYDITDREGGQERPRADEARKQQAGYRPAHLRGRSRRRQRT